MNKLAAILLTILAVICFYLFWHPQENYCYRYPVRFASHTDLPYIAATIEEQSYPVMIDLGSHAQMSLRHHVLGKTKKTKFGISRWANIKGKEYVSEQFLLPTVYLGKLRWDNVVVYEADEGEYRGDATIWGKFQGDADEICGKIGREIIYRTNLLLDFGQSVMFATNQFSLLQGKGYSQEKMASIPLQLSSCGIMIEVETDLGLLRCLLDTGCTFSMIRTQKIEETKQFLSSKCIIGQKPMGKIAFFPYDFALPSDIDAIIGVDFLKSHIVYIDLPHRRLSISTGS